MRVYVKILFIGKSNSRVFFWGGAGGCLVHLWHVEVPRSGIGPVPQQ